MTEIIEILIRYEKLLCKFYSNKINIDHSNFTHTDKKDNKFFNILYNKQILLIRDLEEIGPALKKSLIKMKGFNLYHYFDAILSPLPEDPHSEEILEVIFYIEKSILLYYYELGVLLEDPSILNPFIEGRQIFLQFIYNELKNKPS